MIVCRIKQNASFTCATKSSLLNGMMHYAIKSYLKALQGLNDAHSRDTQFCTVDNVDCCVQHSSRHAASTCHAVYKWLLKPSPTTSCRLGHRAHIDRTIYLGTQEQARGARQFAKGTRGNGSIPFAGRGRSQGAHVILEQLVQQRLRALMRCPGTLIRARIHRVGVRQRGSNLRTQAPKQSCAAVKQVDQSSTSERGRLSSLHAADGIAVLSASTDLAH